MGAGLGFSSAGMHTFPHGGPHNAPSQVNHPGISAAAAAEEWQHEQLLEDHSAQPSRQIQHHAPQYHQAASLLMDARLREDLRTARGDGPRPPREDPRMQPP